VSYEIGLKWTFNIAFKKVAFFDKILEHLLLSQFLIAIRYIKEPSSLNMVILKEFLPE
jgi:hypothetical protein